MVCPLAFKRPAPARMWQEQGLATPRVMTSWEGGNRASSVARKFPRNHLGVARGLLSSFSVCFAVGVTRI